MNTNEKLLIKIFDRKELRRDDIVSILGNAEDAFQKNIKIIDVQYQPFSLLYKDRARKLQESLELEDVMLQIPTVTLSDVLVKMNEHEKELLIDQEGKMIQYEWNGIDDILKVKAEWQLQKNLWLQSDETKKFIAEILTKE